MTLLKNQINENSLKLSRGRITILVQWPKGGMYVACRKNWVLGYSLNLTIISVPETSLEYFMTLRKNQINENALKLSRGPFKILLEGPKGQVYSVSKKLRIRLFTQSGNKFSLGDFPRIFYDPTKESDHWKFPRAFSWPDQNFTTRAKGVDI